jgi:C-terminal domain of Sin3a protein
MKMIDWLRGLRLGSRLSIEFRWKVLLELTIIFIVLNGYGTLRMNLINQDEDLRRLGIQLLNKEDLTLDQASTREEQWAYYVDSYYMHADTEGVAADMLSAPWLRRSVSINDIPREPGLAINQLQVKICLNTYKLFYLVNTEDTTIRSKASRKILAYHQEFNKNQRQERGKKWTRDGKETKEEQDAAAAAAAAAAEANKVVLHPSSIGASATQTTPPAAPSEASAVQAEPAASAELAPTVPTAVDQVGDEVKVESPPLPTSGEKMDVEPTEPAVALEPVEQETKASNEDVEMTDA